MSILSQKWTQDRHGMVSGTFLAHFGTVLDFFQHISEQNLADFKNPKDYIQPCESVEFARVRPEWW